MAILSRRQISKEFIDEHFQQQAAFRASDRLSGKNEPETHHFQVMHGPLAHPEG
jgi:hypothetical protein